MMEIIAVPPVLSAHLIKYEVFFKEKVNSLIIYQIPLKWVKWIIEFNSIISFRLRNWLFNQALLVSCRRYES